MVDDTQSPVFGLSSADFLPTAPPGQWLTLIIRVAVPEVDAQMRIARTLESLGTATLVQGVYLLPWRHDLEEGLDELGGYVRSAGGDAEVVILTSRDMLQEARLRTSLDRTMRYAAIEQTVSALSRGLGLTEPAAIARVLTRQREELLRVMAIDYFPGPARDQARATVESAEAAVKAALFPEAGRATLPERGARSEFFHRIWVTRQPLWADRLGSAWLIRRFIDVESHLIWLARDDLVPGGVLGFGFAGAVFQNSTERTTFEQLLDYFRMGRDGALIRLAALVRDLETGSRDVAESAAIEQVMAGAVRRAEGDPGALLAAMEQVFDQIYETFLDHPRKVR